MQRGYTALVECVGVRAASMRKEMSSRCAFESSARTSICGVVERFGSSSVVSANGGALYDQ